MGAAATNQIASVWRLHVNNCEWEPSSGTPWERATAAVVAAHIADAAAVPMHWCYRVQKLDRYLEEYGDEVEFVDPPANPFYRVPPGSQSCYGDEAWLLILHLCTRGYLDVNVLASEFISFFGQEGAGGYYDPQQQINLPDSWYKQTPRPDSSPILPLQGGWLHRTVKQLLRRHQGAVGKQPAFADADCLAFVPALVARFGTQEQVMEESLTSLVGYLQNTEKAISYSKAAASVLKNIIAGSAPPDAVSSTIEALETSDHECDLFAASDLRSALQDAARGESVVSRCRRLGLA